jgi:recombination protein RecA
MAETPFTFRLITVDSYRVAQVATEDNTVGSLSKEQRSLIVGSLLGDGAMRCKTNALIEFNHGAHQRAYVDWKYRQLAALVGTPPKLRSGNGGRVAYRFTTLSLPELTPYYRAFYSEGRKVVPEMDLTPLALAVWFMDDGSKSYRALYLNTQQFDLESQERLMAMLTKQWSIRATLNRDKSYHRIRIAVESVARFIEIVRPHMLDEMLYKFPGHDPVTTDPLNSGEMSLRFD